jgi:hypothetical protein
MSEHSAPHSARGRTLQAVLIILTGGLLLWRLIAPVPAEATTILFTATDLPDTTPGEDLWQYTYQVSAAIFQTHVGFSVSFDYTLYRTLEDPPPAVHADWHIQVLQPDPALPADGLYDALALVDGASLAAPFVVRFLWLGGRGTAPGAQPFTVDAFDAQGTFIGTIETGATRAPGPTAAVPEPGTLYLLSTALVGITAWRGTRRVEHPRWGSLWSGEIASTPWAEEA